MSVNVVVFNNLLLQFYFRFPKSHRQPSTDWFSINQSINQPCTVYLRKVYRAILKVLHPLVNLPPIVQMKHVYTTWKLVETRYIHAHCLIGSAGTETGPFSRIALYILIFLYSSLAIL